MKLSTFLFLGCFVVEKLKQVISPMNSSSHTADASYFPCTSPFLSLDCQQGYLFLVWASYQPLPYLCLRCVLLDEEADPGSPLLRPPSWAAEWPFLHSFFILPAFQFFSKAFSHFLLKPIFLLHCLLLTCFHTFFRCVVEVSETYTLCSMPQVKKHHNKV